MTTRKEKNGFALTESNPLRVKLSATGKDDANEIQDLQIPPKNVAHAFAKVEQDNDAMIMKMCDMAMSKITSSIIQAEKLNDVKLRGMISGLPNYAPPVVIESSYGLHELSAELASNLK